MQMQYAVVWYKNQLHWGKQAKATHLYIVPCLQQNLQQKNPSRSGYSLKSEVIQSDLGASFSLKKGFQKQQ